MFLRFVDELTVSHIRVLTILNDPRAAIAKTRKELRAVGPLSLVIFHCLPELQRQGVLCLQVCRDLEARGLLQDGSLTVTMSIPGELVPRTTDFGKEFLRFIS
jgi:hypothetical protein